MPQRFGQAVDYGSTFQYLADRNYDLLRAQAQQFDARREEEQAAKDALTFEKYEQGKISGAEILAYIRQRINQTGYDRTQQLRWKQALVQYGNAIADERAEADYAETGDIHALIAHYQRRVSGTAKGTPERTELAQRLRSLRDARDAQSLKRGIRRIQRQIETNRASTRDLIAFYKQKLQELPAGELKQQVRDALAQAQSEWRAERFQAAMAKVDATPNLTPQEQADQKKAILDQFGIKNSDPSAYWQWIDEIRALRATPDPNAMAKLYFDLSQNRITLEQFQTQLFDWADEVQKWDAQAAWELRNTAVQGISGATPLPNPEAIGQGGANALNRIVHISQLDGSKFSQVNCVAAAGAMLAHAMGVKDLSGGDVRWKTGDTSGGLTLGQLQIALEGLGVEGTKLRYDNAIAFERFKQRVMNGSPAVLSGFNGDIPRQYNASGINAGHGVFVAGYDPQKDKFLILDPAKSSDKGTWWPASVVESFGWGNGDGNHYGHVLFAPRGTIDPSTLSDLRGVRTLHVGVDDPPRRPETPSSYRGQFNPGLADTKAAPKAEAARQRREQRRRERAKLNPEADTTEEVDLELQQRQATFIETNRYIKEWMAQYAESGGEADTFDITIGNETRTLSMDDIANLQREMLYLLDSEELYLLSLDKVGNVESVRDLKLSILKDSQTIGSIQAEVAEARANREFAGKFDAMFLTNDISGIGKLLDQYIETMSRLYQPEPQEPQDELASEVDKQAAEIGESALPETEQKAATILELYDAMSDPATSSDDLMDMLISMDETGVIELPKGWEDGIVSPSEEGGSGDILLRAVTARNAQWDVDNGLAQWVLTSVPGGPGETAYGRLETLPVMQNAGFTRSGTRDESSVAVQAQTETGETVEGTYGLGAGTLLDLSGVEVPPGYGTSDDLPRVGISTPHGAMLVQAVPVITQYPGVQFLRVKNVGDLRQFGISAEGGYLSNDQIASLEARGELQKLIDGGALEAVPYEVQSITLPAWKDSTGRLQPPATWYQDPGTRKWHDGGLPFVASGINLGGGEAFAYVGVDREESKYGRPVPDVELDVDVMDDTTVGFDAPFMRVHDPVTGKAKDTIGGVFRMPTGGITVQQMQDWQDQGLLGRSSGFVRGEDGSIQPGVQRYDGPISLIQQLNMQRMQEEEALREDARQANIEGGISRARAEYTRRAMLAYSEREADAGESVWSISLGPDTERTVKPQATFTPPEPKPEPGPAPDRDEISWGISLGPDKKPKAPKVDVPKVRYDPLSSAPPPRTPTTPPPPSLDKAVETLKKPKAEVDPESIPVQTRGTVKFV